MRQLLTDFGGMTSLSRLSEKIWKFGRASRIEDGFSTRSSSQIVFQIFIASPRGAMKIWNTIWLLDLVEKPTFGVLQYLLLTRGQILPFSIQTVVEVANCCAVVQLLYGVWCIYSLSNEFVQLRCYNTNKIRCVIIKSTFIPRCCQDGICGPRAKIGPPGLKIYIVLCHINQLYK